MSLWSRLRDFLASPFGGSEPEPARSDEPDISDWEGEPPEASSFSHDFTWSVAGYIPIGETYQSGFRNFDPDSDFRDKQRFPIESFPSDWDFLGDIDVAYIKIEHANGQIDYVRIAGPFPDWADLERAIDDWWERGS